jgi:hypothetical protein
MENFFSVVSMWIARAIILRPPGYQDGAIGIVPSGYTSL